MKPVNLNQLLIHPKNLTALSFFLPQKYEAHQLESFLEDMKTQLQLRGKHKLEKLLINHYADIKKIVLAHPHQSIGFFLSEKTQGYILLNVQVESYCIISSTFHVRPILEELFVNPDYIVVNVSLYDIKIYRGDFHHLEIIKQFEFDELAIDLKARVFSPKHVGLIPYKTILALKSIARQVREMTQYESIPIVVTGLDEMKQIFLNSFSHTYGIISHVQEDFYEKTCVEILEKCKMFRYSVIDFYSAQFKEKLKKMVKSKRLLSDLGEIILAAKGGKVLQLVIPTEKKLLGFVSFETGEYEILKKSQKNRQSVDILNELAEEVIRQGGKIQILAPHFFPQDSHALAILRS